jgi:hypothetical protein
MMMKYYVWIILPFVVYVFGFQFEDIHFLTVTN